MMRLGRSSLAENLARVHPYYRPDHLNRILPNTSITLAMADSDSDSDLSLKEFTGIISEDLVDVRPPKPAGTTDLDFDGLLSTPLRLHEDLKTGCGGQLWPAGMVLTKYLLREPQLSTLHDKRM